MGRANKTSSIRVVYRKNCRDNPPLRRRYSRRTRKKTFSHNVALVVIMCHKRAARQPLYYADWPALTPTQNDWIPPHPTPPQPLRRRLLTPHNHHPAKHSETNVSQNRTNRRARPITRRHGTHSNHHHHGKHDPVEYPQRQRTTTTTLVPQNLRRVYISPQTKQNKYSYERGV